MAGGSIELTSLRLIAGFEQPTSGQILLDGADVSAVPSHGRNVHVTKAELRSRVGDALSLVSMTRFASRRPAQLSGGQQ